MYNTNGTALTSAIDEQVILINSGYINNMKPRIQVTRTTWGGRPAGNTIYNGQQPAPLAGGAQDARAGSVAVVAFSAVSQRRN